MFDGCLSTEGKTGDFFSKHAKHTSVIAEDEHSLMMGVDKLEKPRYGGFMRILYSLRANEFDKYYLTLRERQVANRILDGEQASTIANSLYLSESCIRYHMSNIYKKANVSTRQEFTRKIRAGIDRSTDPCR